MNYRKIFGILAMLLAAGFINCSKVKTVVTDTALIENPGEKKPAYVPNGKVKRGETVKFIEEKSVDGKKFVLVQLEGVSTKGWMEDKNLKDGKLKTVTVTVDSDLYSRPNEKSDKAGTVRAGQVAFVLEESGNFSLIQYPGKEAFIMKSNLGDSASVVKSIAISGLGKAVLSASSQYVSSEGKELQYDPRNLFDGSLQSSWCEGKSADDGIGEFVTLTFENYMTLTNVSIVNGNAASEASYKGNNRVSSLKITTDSGNERVLDLADNNYDYQAADTSISGKSFKFIINGIHKGTASDTCISEIKLTGYTGYQGGPY